jgi:hypothetical protein
MRGHHVTVGESQAPNVRLTGRSSLPTQPASASTPRPTPSARPTSQFRACRVGSRIDRRVFVRDGENRPLASPLQSMGDDRFDAPA